MEHDRNVKLVRSQLVEAYSKVMYTYETQQQAENIKTARQNRISVAQISLTALSSAGFIGVAVNHAYFAALLSSALAVLSLGLNLYSRGATLAEDATRHRAAADGLWPILQDYISLLVDLDNMELAEIRAARQKLQARTEEQYINAPRTDRRAYNRARKVLKFEEGQSFQKNECDQLLPIALRSDNM